MNLQGRIWSYLNKNDLFRVKIQLVGQIGTVPAGLGLKANSEAGVIKNFKTFSVNGSFDTLNSLVA